MPSEKKSDSKPCRRWDPQGLPTNFAMLCSSARRAGKTTLLKSLCIQEPGAWLSRFEGGFITVFAGNEHCASEYRSKYVHSSLRLDVIQRYWEWCDKQRASQKPLPPCLMIFDDVLVTQSSKKYGVTRTSNNYTKTSVPCCRCKACPWGCRLYGAVTYLFAFPVRFTPGKTRKC